MIINIDGLVGEVYESVQTLCRTPVGTVPFDRNYGIDMSCIDRPQLVAEALLRAELEEKIAHYEPRALVVDLLYETNVSGELQVKVVLAYATESV